MAPRIPVNLSEPDDHAQLSGTTSASIPGRLILFCGAALIAVYQMMMLSQCQVWPTGCPCLVGCVVVVLEDHVEPTRRELAGEGVVLAECGQGQRVVAVVTDREGSTDGLGCTAFGVQARTPRRSLATPDRCRRRSRSHGRLAERSVSDNDRIGGIVREPTRKVGLG